MRTSRRCAQPLVCLHRMALKITLQTQKQTQQRNKMEPTTETPTDQPSSVHTAAVAPSPEPNPVSSSPAPLPPAASCPTCASPLGPQARSYVYALGRIEPRFPSPAV